MKGGGLNQKNVYMLHYPGSNLRLPWVSGTDICAVYCAHYIYSIDYVIENGSSTWREISVLVGFGSVRVNPGLSLIVYAL